MLYNPSQSKFEALITHIGSFKAPDGHWLSLSPQHHYQFTRPPYFSIVPQALHRAEDNVLYLQHQSKENRPCQHDFLPFTKMALVYPILRSQHKPYGCVYAPFLDALNNTLDSSNAEQTHLHFEVGQLFVTCFKEGKMQLCQSYPFKTKEDILYYSLAAMQNTQIDPRAAIVTYSGFLRDKTKLKQLLSQFIAHLEALETTAEPYQFADAFKDLPRHFYADVFTLPACV